jgi:CheY-like chemotaxis protein
MKKILLIDDERIFHFLSTKIFEISGISCEIQSAFDGREGLKLLAEGADPHYIFVDLDMPNINGFEFVEAYKKNWSHRASKVIVLSSSVTEEERKRVLSLGADLYMSKPLREEDVTSLLN